jgi:hypothetical protein
MSLVRVGLSENKKFGENYDAIFGKKKPKANAKKKPSPRPTKPKGKS